MSRDVLYEPLGQTTETPRPRRGRGALLAGLGGAAIAALSLGALFLVRQREPGPVAEATIQPAPPPPPPSAAPAPPAAAPAPSSGVLSASEVDRASGVMITRPDGTSAGTAAIIQVPQDLTVSLQRAPDLRLVEQSRYGLLPKRGADGARPLEVYARPLVTDSGLPPNAPRIAIVVGGMGLNAPATAAAAAELPPAITLAFAPYGDVLDAQVQSARDGGHEAILQVPMDSAGQPPAGLSHILRVGDDTKETLDRLHWQMTRFTGYVGIANFLGGTFTAAAQSLTPVLGDVAQRGLMYFDDGTAARSLAPSLAPKLGLPVVHADVVLDGVNQAAAIDSALAKLEKQARERGFAVGFASALPLSIDRVSAFARGLASRGVALVPVSTLANTGTVAAKAANP